VENRLMVLKKFNGNKFDISMKNDLMEHE